jgi:hypothetical protein
VYGTVFELTRKSDGGWMEKVLHSFNRKDDGMSPRAGLIFDDVGHLYGTCYWGGARRGNGVQGHALTSP